MVTPSPGVARSSRLGLRATPEQETVLRRAAKATNKTLTEFILDCACMTAQQTLLNQRAFTATHAQRQGNNQRSSGPSPNQPGLSDVFAHMAPRLPVPNQV
jgi:uncharacterized protein (DUF1778 family)